MRETPPERCQFPLLHESESTNRAIINAVAEGVRYLVFSSVSSYKSADVGIFRISNSDFIFKDSEKFREALREIGVDLSVIDPVYHLSMGAVNEAINLRDIHESFKALAKYLSEIDNPAPYICAVSYLGKYAQRYGFDVYDFPPEFMEKDCFFEKELKKMESSPSPKKREMAKRFSPSDYKFCIISTKDFLEKFSSQ